MIASRLGYVRIAPTQMLLLGLVQFDNAAKRLFHPSVLVRFVANILNDFELVWEWWVRKRCVNDWYIVAKCVRINVRKRGTWF
jgi:hypothetical protein